MLLTGSPLRMPRTRRLPLCGLTWCYVATVAATVHAPSPSLGTTVARSSTLNTANVNANQNMMVYEPLSTLGFVSILFYAILTVEEQ